ncbi:hypothetical protein KKF82_07200, partial [Patescibacteria group bacterium]|nr:hypothetical protein [Patescibacteria group bacterium]
MKEKSINDTDEFYKELAREGKVKNLNEPKHMKAVREVNETCREAKMEFPPRSLYTKAPHCCPVCGGNGKVLNGFYDQ